jgi:hypothetical protein
MGGRGGIGGVLLGMLLELLGGDRLLGRGLGIGSLFGSSGGALLLLPVRQFLCRHDEKTMTDPVTSFHEFNAETVDVSFHTSDNGKEEVRYHPGI